MLFYEIALKIPKMKLKLVTASENTSTSSRLELYLKLVKHGLGTLVWLTSYDRINQSIFHSTYLFPVHDKID
jgi:hypothetical protein